MSNEMVVREDDFNSSLMQIESTQKMCEALMRTAHYAKMTKDGVFAIVTTARSLGIDPIRALNGGLYYLQGKVGMSTELMASLIREKGHSIVKDPKSSPTVCILHGKRGDNGDTWTISFSIDDAKRAGIYNDKTPWGKYPQIMMYNRAMSTLARQLFPDVIKGVGYEKDELEEIAKSKSYVAQPQQRDEFEEIKSSISKEKSHELSELLDKCSDSYKDQVWNTLQKMGIYSLDQLAEETYVRIKSAALKQIESNVKPLDLPEVKEIQELDIPQ
jgi:hypothetical protein